MRQTFIMGLALRSVEPLQMLGVRLPEEDWIGELSPNHGATKTLLVPAGKPIVKPAGPLQENISATPSDRRGLRLPCFWCHSDAPDWTLAVLCRLNLHSNARHCLLQEPSSITKRERCAWNIIFVSCGCADPVLSLILMLTCLWQLRVCVPLLDR